MAYHAPTKCPVCGAEMTVTHLQCEGGCGSQLTGRFVPCRFCALPEKELAFLETFLRCRGSIKDVEREMGISYPTVRNLLDQTLRALGLAEEEAPAPTANTDARGAILGALERGEISTKQAMEKLRSLT